MLINLYTSREILNTLGEIDFGIWNLIASFILLFSFIQNSLSSTTQRFLSVEIAKNDSKSVISHFYNSYLLYFIVFIVVLVLSETLGSYFIAKLKIPGNRLSAAELAYHFVILDFSFKILRLPFDSMILAYEKMKFYAYISIVEGLIALLIVFILKFIPLSQDKLIIYAVLMVTGTFIVNLVFYWYCFKNWKVSFFKFNYNKQIFKKLYSFTSWNLLGGVATVFSIQGANILINLFFGVIVNAGMSIANQASTAVNKFVYNFQLAYIPHITKSYHSEDAKTLTQIITSSSKLSFLLCWILAFPLIFNIDYIFTLWLVETPLYAKELCQLILITFLIECTSTPLWIAIQADGRIKIYQIVYSLVMLLNIVFSYIFLKLGYNIYFVLYVKIVISTSCLLVRLIFAKKYAIINFLTFIKSVVAKCFLLAIVTALIVFLGLNFMENGLLKLVVSSFCFIVITIFAAYFLFFDFYEKTFIIKTLHKFNMLKNYEIK